MLSFDSFSRRRFSSVNHFDQPDSIDHLIHVLNFALILMTDSWTMSHRRVAVELSDPSSNALREDVVNV